MHRSGKTAREKLMHGTDNFRAPFKYTIPITRAVAENGELFIEGEASGPEIDTFGTRMDPGLISNFADQIATRAASGDPISYRDTHGMGVTGDNGVMVDLGELVAATVTDEDHLRVRVRLDRENPAAVYLHKQVMRGKRYGMSIGGTIVDFTDEYVKDLGRIVRTFKDIVLDHIANTSQPSWTPSLGTVLTRAVEKALEGENMDPEVPAPETPETEGETENPAPEAGAEESVEEAAEEAAEEEAEEPAAEEAVAESRTIEVSALQPIHDAITALATAFAGVMTPATGTVAVTLSAANDAARSVESESPAPENEEMTALRAAVESLRTELATANDRIAQLEDQPEGSKPPVIERSAEDLKEELNKLPAHERLVLGLQAARAATNQ